MEIATQLQGNHVIGILREAKYKWERRCLLIPSHAARLLRAGPGQNGGVSRIIVQPSEKRIYRDNQYEEVGCEISEDLQQCGTIFGVKQPQVGTLLPDRSYAFFSHTHKAQPENMPLLDEVLNKRVRLFDYELIVNDQGSRLVAFGEFAGRAGMVDFLRGLGEKYLSLGYSTPFLSLGSSYMYPSLAAAKAAVLAVGEEIASVGLPAAICPITFVFTGTGNVSRGAQEVFRLLPHQYVAPHQLPHLATSDRGAKAQYQVYATVSEAQHMVAPNDPAAVFQKAEYYARPEQFHPIFHATLAPHATAIINCMYWERRFPRLLTTQQLQELAGQAGGMKLLGVADITCDVKGSIECLTRSTDIEKPFFRYDPVRDSYHDDMDGPGLFLLGVDILPTELAREATKHFGDALFPFVGALAGAQDLDAAPEPMKRACIAAEGRLTPLFEYITRMREHQAQRSGKELKGGPFSTVISLSGHLFDKFLINEALDVIETAGGRFSVASCHVGQSSTATSSAELHVSADSAEKLAEIVEALAEVAGVFFPTLHPAVQALTRSGTIEKARQQQRSWNALHTAERRSLSPVPRLRPGGFAASLEEVRLEKVEQKGPRRTDPVRLATDGGCEVGKSGDAGRQQGEQAVSDGAIGRGLPCVLLLGAGRMCDPVVRHLTADLSLGCGSREASSMEQDNRDGVREGHSSHTAAASKVDGPAKQGTARGGAGSKLEEWRGARVTVASLYLEDAHKVAAVGGARCQAVQLDTRDTGRLQELVRDSDVVLSLLPPACHVAVAQVCIGLGKNLVTASYVSNEMQALDEAAKEAGVTILCEMGLDPGIDHMSAMKLIDGVHAGGGKVCSFVSSCGGLPAPAAADNPLGYKFSWNPRGAILAGRNAATYKMGGKVVQVEGPALFSSAERFKLPHLPALALERLPNRDSLIYGDLYGITGEVETLFRATLRYEGFSLVMDCFGRLGLFDPAPLPALVRPATCLSFLEAWLQMGTRPEQSTQEREREVLAVLKHRLEEALGGNSRERVERAIDCAKWLGLTSEAPLPAPVGSPLDLLCNRMEHTMAYQPGEQDMVVLHHEVVEETAQGAGRRHTATLLAFGESASGRGGHLETAMATTVGLPVAIGAQLLLQRQVANRGVLRPVTRDIYIPALKELERLGVHFKESILDVALT